MKAEPILIAYAKCDGTDGKFYPVSLRESRMYPSVTRVNSDVMEKGYNLPRGLNGEIITFTTKSDATPCVNRREDDEGDPDNYWRHPKLGRDTLERLARKNAKYHLVLQMRTLYGNNRVVFETGAPEGEDEGGMWESRRPIRRGRTLRESAGGWFDENGWLLKEIPQECVDDCSHPGECAYDVKRWVDELGFEVPRRKAIEHLRGYGAWDDLEDVDDSTLAERVLWMACGDIREEGYWDGLVH